MQHLDLSLNSWRSVPRRLGCHFPQLTHLTLRQNWLRTLDLDISCLRNIETIDLTNNQYMGRLDAVFQRTADSMPEYSLVMSTQFKCDCKSKQFIRWLQRSNRVRDLEQLACYKASPVRYRNARLVELKVENLTCEVPLDFSKAALGIPPLPAGILLLPTICFLSLLLFKE